MSARVGVASQRIASYCIFGLYVWCTDVGGGGGGGDGGAFDCSLCVLH